MVSIPGKGDGHARAQGNPIGEVLSVLLIGWPATVVLLTGIGFCLGISIGPFHLWFGLLIATIAAATVASSLSSLSYAFTILISIVLLGCCSVGQLFDLSFDGQVYHIPAVIALADGWNPMLHTTLAEWNAEFAKSAGAGIYIEHYAKGAWIFEAAVYKATGHIELGKTINIILIAAAFSITKSLLQQMGMSRSWKLALSMAAAFNPVAIYQAATFYVDGQLASLFTICLLLSLDYMREPRRWVLALLSGAFLLLIEVKFTGLVYAILIISGLSSGAWLAGKRHAAINYAATLFFLCVIAVGLIGYQPYITNTINNGNPFYPAIGQEAGKNIQWKQAPPEFIAMNRFEKLTRSVFARTDNSNIGWKLPLFTSKSELLALTGADARYAGLGPLYSGILMLAAFLALASVKNMPRIEIMLYAAILGLIIMTVLINPEAWWARLSPQLWLLPAVVAAATAVHGNKHWKQWIAALTITLMLGNSLLLGFMNINYSIERSRSFDALLARLHSASQDKPIEIMLSNGFQVTTTLRLKKYGVHYRNVEVIECNAKHNFAHILKTCVL
jgi:hypothetical protein